MSTRATYRFTSDQPSSVAVTVYIHHDGYPQGAACYLWAAYKLHRTGGRGGMGTCFVRANDRAEITAGHSAHSDTEYRYNVTTEKGDVFITCYERIDWKENGENWRVKWSGRLVDFLNEHTDFTSREGFQPLRVVKLSTYGGAQAYNADLARPVVVSAVDHLEIWAGNGVMTRKACNWQNCEDEANRVLAEFPELAGEFAGRLAEAIRKVEAAKQ